MGQKVDLKVGGGRGAGISVCLIEGVGTSRNIVIYLNLFVRFPRFFVVSVWW